MELEKETEAASEEEVDAVVAEYEQQMEAEIPSQGQETPAATLPYIKATPEQEKKLDELLKDGTALLNGLTAQLRELDKTFKVVPGQIEKLQAAASQVECIANGLASDIRDKSLEQYKRILEDVGGNFNRLVQEADQWQKMHDKALSKKREASYTAVIWAAVSMPVLARPYGAVFRISYVEAVAGGSSRNLEMTAKIT